MRITLARSMVVVLVGYAMGGCNAVSPSQLTGEDAPRISTADAAAPSNTQDGPRVSINLDSPGAGEVAKTGKCGDGFLNPAEECDDGNKTSGDGCSGSCKRETDWQCLTPGSPCVSTVVCGDGRISGNEVCDDHNNNSGDGCSDDCTTVEVGWVCLAAGVLCQPKCGDALLTGPEECDDGNTTSGDGCSSVCKVEPGYACAPAGAAAGGCHKTVCGDGNMEGSEACDDGNLIPGDGCTHDCASEPVCTGTSGCTSVCGDGLKMPNEECDDGNKKSGDGCSADCKLENDWKCTQKVDGDNTTLTVPIIYRDMIPQTAPATLTPPPHPNFEVPQARGLCLNIVQDTLAADRKPVWNPTVSLTNSNTTNAHDFDSWYHDSDYSKMVLDNLTFTATANGTFVYDNSSQWDTTTRAWKIPAFFPLDNRGWAATPDGPEIPYLGTCSYDNQKHNFSFTSELRYWFEYRGNERLDFIGDDDVWVFVNGQLAVDLGGVHEATAGSVTLDATAAAKFGLTVGQIYETVVFQAERRVSRSSYKLTLGQFSRTHTVCTPSCGDGIINGTEQCDDGPKNRDDAYGGCTTQCTIGPYCGDSKVDNSAGEECDDGTNASGYGQSAGCAPGCKAPPYCGDGKVDGQYGEQCDDGADNGKADCTLDCQGIIP